MAKIIHKAKKLSEKLGKLGLDTQLLATALLTVKTAKAHKKELAAETHNARIEIKGASKALKATLRAVKQQKKALKETSKQ